MDYLELVENIGHAFPTQESRQCNHHFTSSLHVAHHLPQLLYRPLVATLSILLFFLKDNNGYYWLYFSQLLPATVSCDFIADHTTTGNPAPPLERLGRRPGRCAVRFISVFLSF